MGLFILRFILFSGLLFLSYKWLFSKKSFFQLNRSILLIIPAVSLLIPAVGPMINSPFESEPVINSLLPEIIITGTIYEQPLDEATQFNYWWLLYSVGAALILTLLSMSLVRAWSILQSARHAFENVYFSDKASGPFAFFKYIVIPSHLSKSKELSTLLAHEKAHVNQNHAFDNFYYNILSALFWFNPFIHLLQVELKQTHECLADEEALNQSDPENYSRLLLSTVFGSEISFDPAHRFFNSSLIKTRITMIYKTKTKPVMRGLYFLLIPLISIMSITSCQKTEAQASPTGLKAKELTIKEVDRAPVFPGCDAGLEQEALMKCFTEQLMAFISDNYSFPASTKEAGLEGKILVEFNIGKNGETKIIGYKSSFEGSEEYPQAVADAENFAVDLLASLPKMQPAIHEGKPVSISMALPIMLKLE